jgi:hypothetical protein
MAVKCVFYVAEVTKTANGSGRIKANPVAKGPYSDYSKWTPSGSFEITSLNEKATEWFESMLGKDIVLLAMEPQEGDLIPPPA